MRGRDGGYLLRVDPSGLDSSRFDALLSEGRDALAAGQATGTVDTLRAALGLWRGAAFAEIADTPLAQPVAARLEQDRIEAVEELAEAQLAAGQPGALPLRRISAVAR